MGATGASQTKAEQERLFREAERDFEARQHALLTTGEAAVDAGMVGTGTSSPAHTPGALPPAAAAAAAAPDKSVLDALAGCMHANNEEYLDTLLRPAVSSLPGEMVAQLRSDVQVTLETHVDGVLEKVILISRGDAPTAKASDPAVRSLATQFTAVMAQGTAGGTGAGSPMDDFCKGVLSLPVMKKEMEPLCTALITFAQTRLREATAAMEAGEGGQ